MASAKHKTSGPTEKHGLFVLYPQDDTDTAVDIVAIHGLGGDAFATWTEDNKKMWLRDFLPSLMPQARIMTFGYDSSWAFSRSVAGITEFALELLNRLRYKRWSAQAMNKPIFFVCHSLGGIVCKKACCPICLFSESSREALTSMKALILSKEQPFFANILQKTQGVMFFGTPHRGSRIATWAKVMANYVNACLYHSPMRSKLLKDLGPNSDALAIISSDFKFLVSKIQIITFYESEMLLPLKDPVVEKESAVLGIPNERAIPMAADHRNMVRFSSSDSEKFELVRYALQELIMGAPAAEPQIGSHNTSESAALMYAMEAFQVTDYFEHLSSVAIPAPGTCEWVPSHVSFQDWLGSSESDMLWLRGYPGVGKTVITKHLIESVIPSRRALRNIDGKSTDWDQTGDDLLVYFFCNDSNIERKLEENILKAILHQLLTIKPNLLNALKSRIDLTRWSFVKKKAGLWGALEDVTLAAKAKTIYVVLDALDEMEPGSLEGFTAALGRLVGFVRPRIAPRQLKILVTSRPEPKIEQNLQCASIAIRSQHDVRHYITNLVEPFAVYHGFPPHSTEKVIDTLTEKAGNMFLWARLAWTRFKEGITFWSLQRVEERIQALKVLPPGLEALYGNILNRYDDPTLELLMNLFSWLIAATRPLILKELEIALGINESTNSLKDVDIGFSMETQLNIICPNLLAVNPKGCVEFIHQSFKDFLLSPDTNPRYRVDIARAHAKIATCCLRCFTFDDLDAGKIRDSISCYRIRSDTLVQCELLQYASKQWPYHAKSAPKDKRIWEAYLRLYQRRDSFGLWWVMYRYEDRFSRAHWACWANTPLPPPFQLAVALNISYFVEILVSSGVEINQRDQFFSDDGGTVLHNKNIDSKMVRYLIANGADVRMKNRRGDTPLHDALRHYDVQRFLMLLECVPAGVDLNDKDRLGNTVFQSAIAMGFLPVVAKLANDSRVELLLDDGMTPLEFACAWGKEETVRILLASSRVVEAQREKRSNDGAKMSLVFYAVLQGWEELVLYIMQKIPTDIENEVDKDGRTILHHVVMENWHDLLDQCLDRVRRPNLDKMDKNGMTALHWAAKVRNRYAAIRLLDSGAQPGISNHEGRTPLHVAAEAGSEQVLTLLLDRADMFVSEIDNQKRTVLHYAATWDFEPITRRLVNLSPMAINAKDCHGRTAAHLAALFGCPGVLNFLLDQGKTSVNASDSSGNSILHCAVEGGNEACIRNLVNRPELNINLLNDYGKCVIDVAICDHDHVRGAINRAILEERGAVYQGFWEGRPRPFQTSFVSNEESSRWHEEWQLILRK